MNRKQRVRLALQHQETDIIPHFADFTIPEAEKLAAYFGDPHFQDKIGNHIASAEWIPPQEPVPGKPGFFRDFFGSVWNRSGPDKDIGVVDQYLIQEPGLSSFSFPEVDFEKLDLFYRKKLAESEGQFVMAAFGFSLFERAWVLRGMEDLLADMVLEPKAAESLFESICEYNLSILHFTLNYPFDGVYFGDDWGQQRGLIMGPGLWRKFIKPRLKQMYAPCKAKGKFVLAHCCGDISEIFPDLIEVGLDCYLTFQPEIYDIRAVKKQYGNDLSFWGGISTQTLLPFGTPEFVKKETARIMGIMGKGGGYIAAPTHAVPYDVPCENVEAMLHVFQNQKQYL